MAFSDNDPCKLVYKKALAQHALIQSCLMKRPFNLFHRKNLYIRTADVARNFGNKTTWDTPFPVLFKRIVREANACVFGNGRGNQAFHRDVLDVSVDGAELIYIDPPYFRLHRDRSLSNYRLLYHFVEGLVQYERWEHILDPSHRLKALKANGFSTEALYTCKRHKLEQAFLNWLQEVLRAWPNAQVALSYKHPGVPKPCSIKRLIEMTGRKVSIREKPYTYALNLQNGNPEPNLEMVFLGS